MRDRAADFRLNRRPGFAVPLLSQEAFDRAIRCRTHQQRDEPAGPSQAGPDQQGSESERLATKPFLLEAQLPFNVFSLAVAHPATSVFKVMT
jgi:hypothetical protein